MRMVKQLGRDPSLQNHKRDNEKTDFEKVEFIGFLQVLLLSFQLMFFYFLSDRGEVRHGEALKKNSWSRPRHFNWRLLLLLLPKYTIVTTWLKEGKRVCGYGWAGMEVRISSFYIKGMMMMVRLHFRTTTTVVGGHNIQLGCRSQFSGAWQQQQQ